MTLQNDCPRCYAPAGTACFDLRTDWAAFTPKGIARLKRGWRPSYARTKAAPHRERRQSPAPAHVQKDLLRQYDRKKRAIMNELLIDASRTTVRRMPTEAILSARSTAAQNLKDNEDPVLMRTLLLLYDQELSARNVKPMYANGDERCYCCDRPRSDWHPLIYSDKGWVCATDARCRAGTSAKKSVTKRLQRYNNARYTYHHTKWIKEYDQGNLARAARHLYALRAHLRNLGWLLPEYDVPGLGVPRPPQLP